MWELVCHDWPCWLAMGGSSGTGVVQPDQLQCKQAGFFLADTSQKYCIVAFYAPYAKFLSL